MGMLGGAMFDAVNSINRNYSSYLGYFDPTTSGSSTDVTAAAATAAYHTLTSIYADLYGSGNSYQAGFDNLYNIQMTAIQANESRTRGIEVGLAASRAMINARLNDGKDAASSYAPQPFGTVGQWQRFVSEAAVERDAPLCDDFRQPIPAHWAERLLA